MNIKNYGQNLNYKNYIYSKNDPYYKCFFENMVTPMLIIDPETAEIVDANYSACLFYKYSYEDILKLKIVDINILSAEEVDCEMELAKNEERNQFYFRHRISNGKIREVQVLSNPIIIDERPLLWSIINDKNKLNKEEIKKDGKIHKKTNMIFSTIEKEINRRISAEKALKESEARFRALFDNMQLGFSLHEVITDENGEPVDFKFLLINKTYEKVINKSYDNVVGRTMLEVNELADREMIKKYCNVGITGIPAHYEYFSKTFNKYLSVNVFRPKIGQFAATFEDISDKKNMEKEITKARDMAEKASITKSEFIANMSHELKTPINVIFAGIQLFQLYVKNESIEKKDKYELHLSSMKQNCLRLLRIVNNLIDTTKIDSGFYEPSFSNQNIVKIIERIVLSVSDYAKQKQIDIIFDSPIDKFFILCDVDMIERIMLNIISNAIKFTKNMIKISIDRGVNGIIIVVSDNGKGLEKEKYELIFERYKQASNLFTRENEGSGIGLSLTKTLIEKHGGNISVKSNYGSGCEFIIELPIGSKMNGYKKLNNYKYISDDERFMEKMKVEFSDIYK